MTGRVLGVIPARGGSKRVPGKNIKDIAGKPLIAYAIEQAHKAAAIDKTIVSTEAEEIRLIAEEYGATVPFERPSELATDTSTNDEVILHALEWFEEQGEYFDIVSVITATSPLRFSEDITNCVNRLHDSDAQSVVSITDFATTPFWAVDESEEFLSSYFTGDYLWSKTRTQEVPTLRHPNGAVYAARVPAFFQYGSFYTDRTVGYEMPRERSLDIDEPFDLEVCRAIMERRK